MKLGISLHSVTSDISERGLSVFKGAGVGTFEIAQWLFDNENGPEQKECLRKFLSSSGIKAETIHSRFGGWHDISSTDPEVRERAIKSTCDAAVMADFFDATTIVVHASAEPICDAERLTRRTLAVESLRIIHSRSQELRKRLAIELLPRSCLGNTIDELLEIIRPFDDSSVGICLDTNHMMSNYKDMPDMVTKLGKKLFTLHISDYDGIDEKHWLPGRGVSDWPAFMKALEEIGYDGPFNYECTFSPLERVMMLKENYSWLSKAGQKQT